jgi:uncharacterized protein YbaR (Trm112 family)
MPIDTHLLQRLVCPETRQALHVAPAEMVARANVARTRGKLLNRAGNPVSHSIDEGLLNEEGTMLYAVSDGIPIMLPDEGIPVKQLEEV